MDVCAEAGLSDNPHLKVVSDLDKTLGFDRLLGYEAGYGPVLDDGAFVALLVLHVLLNSGLLEHYALILKLFLMAGENIRKPGVLITLFLPAGDLLI